MSTTDQDQITAAVLQSVESGIYPESPDVAAAVLTSESLPPIFKAVKQAKEKVQEEISRLSREIAPDVDGWIQQAQQLQNDIEQSKVVAREIVKQAEKASSLRAARKEAATKLDLLRAEVAFNNKLRNTLESIQRIAETLQVGQDAALQNKFDFALERYEEARSGLSELETSETTIAADMLDQRAQKLRATLVDMVETHWNTLIKVDYEASCISIQDTDPAKSDLGLKASSELMGRLEILDANILALGHDLNNLIFKPRLKPYSDGTVAQIDVGQHELRIHGRVNNKGPVHLIGDLTAILNFLSDTLPPSVSARLSEILMPSLIATFISSWLNSSVNASLEFLSDYQGLLNAVSQFAVVLSDRGWQGSTDLTEWVDDAPKIWLAKRRETSLLSVRDSLTHQIQATKVVERVETQMVKRDDLIAPANGAGDDWDAGWSEDVETHIQEPSDVQTPVDEDVSAWDVGGDEDISPDDPHTASELQTEKEENGGDDEEDVADAWGWDDQGNQSGPPSPGATAGQDLQVNGHATETNNNERELTLKETYTVTGVPDELLEKIVQIVSDAADLREPKYSESPVAAAAAAMYSIPTLVLAGFRALAPTYYSPIEGGNMYLYNDCVRLASELTSFLDRQATEDAASSLSKSAWPSTRMKLDTDIEALSSFGKRAYGKEMESQRTILGDLLDGAQGFANCTEAPFADACESAVAMTVDRIREVQRQWSPILSKSALLQSLGSLLATVLNKVIVDICDLSDISEEESVRLRKLCDEFTKLSDIFAQESAAEDGQTSDMTGVYTPNWFKFQYLGEILESSLADIKYLWQEGELKLEYDADEVVDLVEALFAESDQRRRAIAEIRRG